MKIKGIIYDFDGVICDSVNVKTKAFAELYKSYGAEIEQRVVDYHLAHGGISRFEKIKYYHEVLLGKSISEEEIQQLADTFASLVKEKVIASAYIKGALPFIKKYSQRLPQYICTGTPESEILEIVERRRITPYFVGIYGAPKKKTEIIQNILDQTGWSPCDFVYFGDAMTDFHAAKAFNMPFIGIRSADTVFPEGTITVQDFKNTEGVTFSISKK
jgi:phosphoglycolate phosphatase-like HAD superfamily hydrolase